VQGVGGRGQGALVGDGGQHPQSGQVKHAAC